MFHRSVSSTHCRYVHLQVRVTSSSSQSSLTTLRMRAVQLAFTSCARVEIAVRTCLSCLFGCLVVSRGFNARQVAEGDTPTNDVY